MTTIPDQLNEDQLERYLTAMIEKIIDKIHDKKPELQLTSDDKKNLAKTVTQMMLQDKNRTELSREAVEMNPKFLHKLTMAIVMTATVKLEKNENLFNKLSELFQSKDIKDENDLQKKLTPQELKELKQLQEELRELNKELFAELKSLNLIQPKPDPSGNKREKELEETFDSNTNLIGLVNTHVTGGLEAVVQVLLGNLFGVTNQNPNYEESESQLALQDKVSDPAGEILGLNHAARENFEALGAKEAEPSHNLIEQTKSLYMHNESLQLKH